jgi:selenocysteine lyase/cysteine desulfurase
MSIVHLNTAGAGLMSSATRNAIGEHFDQERRIGAYEAELLSDTARDTRVALAELLRADVNDIALFDSGTRAWLSCLNSLAPMPDEGLVWTTPYEYAGNLLALQALARRDRLHLQVIPLTPQGDIDIEWMFRNADSSVRLVSVVHVPSACGVVLPIEAIGEVLRTKAPDALYAVDACQSVGQLPIDYRSIGCDLLTAAGRKFLCGPRGTGFALVSPRWRARLGDHPVDLHSARAIDLTTGELTNADSALRLETSERNISVIRGLHCAVREAITTQHHRIQAVYADLVSRLSRREELDVIAPGTRHSGIVSVTHRRMTPSFLVDALRSDGINAWQIDGSHTPIFMRSIGVQKAVRFSVHAYNTTDDLNQLDAALDRLQTPFYLRPVAFV